MTPMRGWHRCDSDVYISVTAMATDTAVTAVTTDSAVSAVAADTVVWAMFTLVWERWQLTVLWQRWKLTALSQRWKLTALWQRCVQRCQLPLLSQSCAHRCHTNMHIAVTLMWTPLSLRCQCHRLHSVVSCHRCHSSVHSSVTALSLSPLLHRCQFTSVTHYTGGILQRLDTDMQSTVTAKMSTALWQRNQAQLNK